MDNRLETRINHLLRGEMDGFAIALRCVKNNKTEWLTEQAHARNIGVLRLAEPCRFEHPHSAFLRKAAEQCGQPATLTTLFAPDGKLHELRGTEPNSDVLEHFVKKSSDFQVLRSYLKDIEQIPVPWSGSAVIASLGLSPRWELEARWAGKPTLEAAKKTNEDAAASCLRKLERLFHFRCEEAARQGCFCLDLSDLTYGSLSVAQTYLDTAAQDLDWMARHLGIPLYHALPCWDDSVVSALTSRNIGLHIDKTSLPALMDMGGCEARLMIELPWAYTAEVDPQALIATLLHCKNAVIVLNCETMDDPATAGAQLEFLDQLQTRK